MGEFLQAVSSHAFMRNALLAGLLTTVVWIATGLDASSHFDVVETGPLTDAQLEAAVEEGRASIAIRPPGADTPGLLIADGSDLFTAQAAARQIQVLMQGLAQQTGAAAYVETRILYNPDLRSINYMIPGLVGIVMVFIATMLTAVAIVRERDEIALDRFDRIVENSVVLDLDRKMDLEGFCELYGIRHVHSPQQSTFATGDTA